MTTAAATPQDQQVRDDVDEIRRHDRVAGDVGRRRLAGQLRADRWQRVSATIVASHNGPLTLDQARAAAVLGAAAPAALAAWTALEADGLRGWERPEVHIVVPRGAHPVLPIDPRVVVHESRRFTAADVGHLARLSRTNPARSAIDASAWSTSDRSACGVLAAVVQQRLTSVARLQQELAVAGQVRRCGLLGRTLRDMAGGATAVSELDFLRFCRRHRLGQPEMQQVRRDAAGRRRYLDATLRSASGRPVHVEIDGALHLAVRSYWDDMQRGNDLLLVGVPQLRFPSAAIYADDPQAVRQLRRALAA